MIEFLIEIALEIFGEMLLGAGFESLIAPFRSTNKANPILAFVGIIVLAGSSGLLLSFLLPHRLFPKPSFPGASLVLAPIITGSALYAFGNWRRSKDKNTTVLASFWGGTLFSFIFALTRFMVVSK